MKDYVEIVVVLDKSGSMNEIRRDTIGGFNNFLEEQRSLPGEARLSLVLFDTVVKHRYTSAPINEVPRMVESDYRPEGGTALLDAVGSMIDTLGQRLASLSEGSRPNKVLFVIMTDGEENSSKEYAEPIHNYMSIVSESHIYDRGKKVKDMVNHQKEKYGWKFVFLGADIDAWTTGHNMGFGAISSYNFKRDSLGVRGAFASANYAMTLYRTGHTAEVDMQSLEGLTKDEVDAKLKDDLNKVGTSG